MLKGKMFEVNYGKHLNKKRTTVLDDFPLNLLQNLQISY